MWLLIAVTLLVAGVALLVPRFAQPASYHQFADGRRWLGIANFGDVISNLGFAVVGAWGLTALLANPRRIEFVDARERWAYVAVFAGMLLVAAGSSYYHLAPDNARLVWDRLPMTIVFMALVGAMIAERVSVRAGMVVLPALLLAGAASVLWWRISEQHGAEDLRFYAAVQIYAVLVVLIALFLPLRYTRSSDLLVVVGLYVLAKLLEIGDRAVFSAGHVVSGHTLKHLVAAGAGWWVLAMLQTRRPVQVQQSSGRHDDID